jgi:foldase protein PrsA
MKKKIIAAVVVVILIAAAVFAVYKMTDKTVFQYGDEKVSLAEVSVYAKIQQCSAESEYGSYFGEEMWTMEVEDGVTLEDSVKDNVIKQVKAVKLLTAHAEEMEISLSDDEKSDAKENAQTFIDSDEGKLIMEQADADEELIQTIYQENALATKVKEAIIDKVDTEVSDEDAQVRTVYKLVFATTKTDADGNEVELSDAEKKKQKAKAQKAYKQLKKGADITALAKQYDISDTTDESYGSGQSEGGEAFETAVAKLKKGQYTSVIEDDEGYVIAKLVTENDKEKTEENKETILENRQNTAYQEQYDAWAKDLEADWDDDKSINTKLWNRVTFKYGEFTSSDSTEASDTETTTESAGTSDTTTEAK